MSETKSLETERAERLHEWFKSSPQVWEDLKITLIGNRNNELDKLKARTCTNREWSAGYVVGYEEVLDLERYYRKIWKPSNKT